ncbi:MAG: HAMP domain-containing sensor histidine kinase [Bacteroidota bacterium]
MKLLQKTRRIYILYSIIIFIISSTIIYNILKNIITKRQDEKLLHDKEIIAQKIKYDYPLPIFDVEDYIAKNNVKDTMYFKDTLMYQIINGMENYELYRQLTSIETLQGKTYRIITRSSQVKNHEFVLAISLSVGVVILLLIITVYFINTIFTKRIWHPFYQNLNSLKNFSVEENKPIELEDSKIDEFKELNNSLTKLTEKLSSDFNNLKEFTENASHEMQTPLAIMQSKLEFLMQSENLIIEDQKLISAVYSASKRLSKLNKTLLMLSKIENQQYSQKESIVINKVINNQLNIFEDFIENKEINISKNLTLDVKVEANPMLFDMVISNLLGNAIKHNQNKGNIHITTCDIFITISNSGKPLNIPSDSLFERFKKESKSSESFGLGLAIVKKICDIYDWKISHSYSDNQHHFSIYF